MKNLFKFFIALLQISIISPWNVYAQTEFPLQRSPRAYPRLANYYLRVPLQASDIDNLSRYDILILGMQAQDFSVQEIKSLRLRNPKIKILAYVASQEVPYSRLKEVEPRGDGVWHRLVAGIQEEMWLYDGRGGIVSTWPGNRTLNVTHQGPIRSQRWHTYLPEFLRKEVWATGLWDGIFFDNCFDNVHWMNEGWIDADRSGQRDRREDIDRWWNEGMVTLLSNMRRSLPSDALLMCNGGQSYQAWLNGRLFEGFGFPWEGGWSGAVDSYRSFMEKSQRPTTTILNFNTDNTGNYRDFSHVRFGLATTLLDNGYFAFDYGTQDHSQILWYDEYNAPLGKPLGPPTSVTTGAVMSRVRPEVWRRDFEGGIVILNSLDFPREISLGGEMEALRGTQDPDINHGRIINKVSLQGRSARILLRPLERIENVVMPAGSFVRVLSTQDGSRVRNGFFATFPSGPIGGDFVHVGDDGLGGTVSVHTDENAIILTQKDNNIKKIYPFGQNAKMNLRFAIGELDTTGFISLIVTGQNSRRGRTPVVIMNFRGEILSRFTIPLESRLSPPEIAVISARQKKPARFVFAENTTPARVVVSDTRGNIISRVTPFAGVSAISIAADNIRGEWVAIPQDVQEPVVARWYDMTGSIQKSVSLGESTFPGTKIAITDIAQDGSTEILVFSGALTLP